MTLTVGSTTPVFAASEPGITTYTQSVPGGGTLNVVTVLAHDGAVLGVAAAVDPQSGGDPTFDTITTDGTVTPSGASIIANPMDVEFPLAATSYAGITAGRGSTTTVSNTTATYTGGGHAIGGFDALYVQLIGSVTMPLAYAQEAVLRNDGSTTTITTAIVHGAHMANNAGTIGLLAFYAPIMSSGENPGTITTTADFFSSDWSGSPDAPSNRYCIFNLDASKKIATAGIIYNATLQEFSPSVGAGYVSGRYYWGITPVSLGANSLPPNTAVCCPFHVQRKATFTKIGCRITTGVGASNLQFAVYPIVNGAVGAKILSTASQSSAATGIVEVTISWSADPGNYLLCANSSGAISVNFSQEAGSAQAFFGATTDTGLESTPYFATALGTWPDNPTLTYANYSNAYPQIWVRL